MQDNKAQEFQSLAKQEENILGKLIFQKMSVEDYMYEYDIDTDLIYRLQFNGERLQREKSWDGELHSEQFKKQVPIHPDDLPLFLMALSKENLDDAYAAGKTVSHMFFRRSMGDGEYRLFMYGMHYYEDMGKRRVLIMARDSEREVL